MFPIDIVVSRPRRIPDERGEMVIMHEDSRLGLTLKRSSSSAGVFRGLHYQTSPKRQDKVFQLLKGRIVDIVVDMEAGSKNFRRLYSKEICSSDSETYSIPSNYAHGFYAMEDSIFQYITLGDYSPQNELVINPPPEVFIKHGIDPSKIILSEKDKCTSQFFKTSDLIL